MEDPDQPNAYPLMMFRFEYPKMKVNENKENETEISGYNDCFFSFFVTIIHSKVLFSFFLFFCFLANRI